MRIAAGFVFVAWLAISLGALTGPERIWWVPPLTFVLFGGPALLVLLPGVRKTWKHAMTFTSSIPDDPPDGDGDEQPIPFGRPALEALAPLLAARGIPVGPVEPHEFYGWRFDGGRSEVMIQGDDLELLIIVTGRDAQAIETALMEILRSDSRFANARKVTGAEDAGSTSPSR